MAAISLGSWRPAWRRRCARAGFTLIEVVISIAILATVLTLAYRILVNILDTERLVARLSTPEKIGTSILSLLQKDLLSVTYRKLPPRVFLGINNGEPPAAADELNFITARDPIAPETIGGQLQSGGSDAFGDERYRTLTAVSWKTMETPGMQRGVLTLFRIENVDFDSADPFQSARGGGMGYEVYDKVRSFSVEYFDGLEWFAEWDSQQRLEEEAALLEEGALGAGDSNIENVTASLAGGSKSGEQMASDLLKQGSAGAGTGLEGEDGATQLLPPAAVPVAVRITVTILAGDEKGAYTDERGFGDFKEFTYSTIVPIPTAIRIPLSSDEELQELSTLGGAGEAGMEGLGGDGAGDGSGGGSGRGGGPTGTGGANFSAKDFKKR
jgi:prepilin-type N-terminal cleavage/methylation domain-containing protein